MLLQPTPRVPLIHQLQNHRRVNIHTLLKLETQLVFTIKETEIDFDKHPIIYAYLFYTNNGPNFPSPWKCEVQYGNLLAQGHFTACLQRSCCKLLEDTNYHDNIKP